MNIRRAGLFLGLISVIYLAALLWLDSKSYTFSGAFSVLGNFPELLILSFFSYILRFARWHFLFLRSGDSVPLIRGFFIYLSGFAFTATPGKVGELIRARYLSAYGIPSSKVLAAFIYERTCDLFVVLILSSMFIQRMDLFIIAIVFVSILFGIIVFLSWKPSLLTFLAARMRSSGAPRLASLAETLKAGLAEVQIWVNPVDAVVSMLLGTAAWTLIAFSFYYLIGNLDISVPWMAGMAIYPLAMLAGAASMLPGGLGSTEATLVALLVAQGAEPLVALLAAISIRLTTLWFSIACGFLSMCWSEIFTKPALYIKNLE